MGAEDVFGPIASVMGVFMSLAPLFQVRRVLERGQADDVSQAFLVVIAVGASAWSAYGISTGDPYLIIPWGRSSSCAAIRPERLLVPLPRRRETAVQVPFRGPAQLVSDRARVEVLAVDLAVRLSLSLDVRLHPVSYTHLTLPTTPYV